MKPPFTVLKTDNRYRFISAIGDSNGDIFICSNDLLEFIDLSLLREPIVTTEDKTRVLKPMGGRDLSDMYETVEIKGYRVMSIPGTVYAGFGKETKTWVVKHEIGY